MKMLSDFRSHLKNGLEGAKLESLIEFYLMAMSLTLLFHIFMQIIPIVRADIHSINILIDWSLSAIIFGIFLVWKASKLSSKTIYCIRLALFFGLIISLLSSCVTYLSIISLAISVNDALLKLLPILVFVSYCFIAYQWSDKFPGNIKKTLILVIISSSIVSHFKLFGIYLLIYFGLPLSILLNLYFIITLIYVTHNELAASKRHD